MARGKHWYTAEAVAIGHPDKVADQISDAILDDIIRQDPYARVACETLVTTGMAIVAGEITTEAYCDMPAVIRQTVKEIGYTDADMGFDCETIAVLTSIDHQSPDIAQAVIKGEGDDAEIGAGDQGIMIGFACRETEELMPMPIMLSRKIIERLVEARQKGEVKYLRPDGKCQVTVEYDNLTPLRVHTVVLSTQHTPDVKPDQLRDDMTALVIKRAIPKRLLDKNTKHLINPSGRFVQGGPKADCGLTGRKIIVDTYGGRGNHGGGCFSGKDPTKVDRTASYMARYIAKNIVASGLADICEVQLSYAIGIVDPIVVSVDTEGTGKIPEENLVEIVRANFPLRPRQMIEYLKLRRPIYKETARWGHFGRTGDNYTWEKTDKAEAIRRAAGV